MSQVLATRIETLQELCVARLRDALDPRSGRFARQVREASWMRMTGPETLAGSAICLIGLGRAGIPPRAVLPDAAGLCRRLAAAIRDEAQPGALGLVLWANGALHALAPLALLAEAGFAAEDLDRRLPGMTTAEVAWLASGLLHADLPALRPAAIAALRELEDRLDRRTLLFAHASAAAPWRLRRRMAGFGDQAFALQALAFAAAVLGDPERRRLADQVGCRMVAAQGPLGQWWAQHDSRGGAVAERYPVLSAQQHSIGPLALRALTLAGGRNHAAAASGSRAWLQANELGIDLVEPSSGIIWGGVARDEGPMARRLRQARLLAGLPAADRRPPRLTLLQAMLPREWGWLLYASALEGGSRPAGHIF